MCVLKIGYHFKQLSDTGTTVSNLTKKKKKFVGCFFLVSFRYQIRIGRIFSCYFDRSKPKIMLIITYNIIHKLLKKIRDPIGNQYTTCNYVVVSGTQLGRSSWNTRYFFDYSIYLIFFSVQEFFILYLIIKYD